MNKNELYSLSYLIETRFADPVSAIGMNEINVVIGSMMGRIAVYNLFDKKTILLAELSSENITGITFENSDTFNIAIGDEEIHKYKLVQSNYGNITPDYIRLKNYPTEESHSMGCDSCFSILSSNHLALIYMSQPDDNNIVIESKETKILVNLL